MERVAGNSGVGDVEKEGGEEGANYNKLVGNGNNGGGISKTTVDARTATVGGEDAPEVPAGRREQGSDTDRKYNLGVGGGDGGGGDGGGGVMFVQAHDTSENRPVVGLLVDLDPRHPAFVAVATFVVILLSACWVRKKFIKKKIAHHVNPTVGGSGVGSGVGGGSSESVGGVYNTHGHRTRSGGRTGGAGIQQPSVGKATATAQQESLCEVLYDVYAGVVPTGGINSKAVRECGLTTAEIRRQFKRIKRARETDVAKGRSPAGVRGAGSPRSPIRVKPMINRHQPRAPDTSTGKGPSTAQSPVRAPSRRSGGKRPPVVSPKKPAAPVSPRKTPGKRGVSTRPAPSPKSGDSSAKRAAGGGRSSAPPTQTQSQIIPATPNSPVVTRGKGIRAPSKLPDSPVSSPRKRAEAGGDRMGGSPGGSTPAKRGAPSTLQLARRDAQLKADAVANARASKLTGGGSKTTVTRSKRAKS